MFRLILLIAISFTLHSNVFAIQSFPSAEGFGAESVGGRGGAVIKVTNLNDSGTGSFREACLASGARIVVFDVSGIINLESTLTVSNSYITIAGQTSPGGILVTGYPFQLNAAHSIIRHMRFRLGNEALVYAEDTGTRLFYTTATGDIKADAAACLAASGPLTTEELGYPCPITGSTDTDLLDAFAVLGSEGGHYPTDANNIIIDHCSFSWGIDETVSTAYNPDNITFQWNIVSEALVRVGHKEGVHSKGFIAWNEESPDISISFHHNYMAHNLDRNPLVNTNDWADGAVFDSRNNVTFLNELSYPMMVENDSKVNWIHNYTKTTDSGVYFEATHSANGSEYPKAYTLGNLGISRTLQTDPEWCVGDDWHDYLKSTNYQASSAWVAATVYPVTTTTMSLAYASNVIDDVGATKPSRDSVDVRVVADYSALTGAAPFNADYPDDYPTFSTPAAPTDTDSDGMSDAWESVYGTNPAVADDELYTNTLDSSYTNIEAYINDLAGDYVHVFKTGLPLLGTN